MAYRVLILISLFFFSFGNKKATAIVLFHPVHISIVNMDFQSDDSIHFSIKLFTDDFEKILNQNNNTTIKLNTNTDLELVRVYLESYIAEHFAIDFGSQLNPKDYHIVELKFNEDAVWLYFDIDIRSYNFESIKISNSLMTDLYQDQTNLFIMNYKGEDKAYRFNNSDRDYIFNLK